MSPEAMPAVANAAVAGRLPERNVARGDKSSRVRSREAKKEDLGADLQPGKRARISKWDQQELSPQGTTAFRPSQVTQQMLQGVSLCMQFSEFMKLHAAVSVADLSMQLTQAILISKRLWTLQSWQGH